MSTVHERARALRRVLEEQAAHAVGPASVHSIPLTLREGSAPAGSAALNSPAPTNSPAPLDSPATQFLALLECTYLVAAADSISTEELIGLSTMIELVTGAELSPVQIQSYFREFAQGVADEGRPARIRAIAESLGDFVARQEALHLAVLFAVADGTVARKETRVLIEVAEAFGHSIGELQAVLDEVAGMLRAALKS